jgi:succinate dehydrogenase hydrophobic anchor subunit
MYACVAVYVCVCEPYVHAYAGMRVIALAYVHAHDGMCVLAFACVHACAGMRVLSLAYVCVSMQNNICTDYQNVTKRTGFA